MLYRIDPRGNLYLRYLAYVSAVKPLALLMENVPDILHYGGHNVVQEMVEVPDAIGYVARYSLISSAFQGCPANAGSSFSPRIQEGTTGRDSFPQGGALYGASIGLWRHTFRSAAFRGSAGWPRLLRTRPSDRISHFRLQQKEAIGDLPPITLHLEGKYRGAPDGSRTLFVTTIDGRYQPMQ